MRRWGFLLKPGWLALAVVVVGFAYACFTVLAPWQLGKNDQTEQRNALIADSFTADVAPLTDVVAPGATPALEQEWRVVEVVGTYQPQLEVLARLRSVETQAAYEVLTPFRTTDGTTVLVDRGYVRPLVGTDAPAVAPAPSGEVVLQARVRLDERVDPTRPPLVVAGTTQVYGINAAAVGQVTGTPISPGYLQLAEGQPGGLGVLPLPMLESGPYLSYGLQWLAFGIMVPLGLAYFVRAELRERRSATTTDTPTPRRVRRADLRDALAGSDTGGSTGSPGPSAALADRYGDRR